MLLNFSAETIAAQPRAIYKGGRWKDRLQAKRSLHRNSGRRPQKPSNATGPNTLQSAHPRLLEPVVDGDHAAKRQKLGDHGAVPQQGHNTTNRSTNTNGEFISSLFTSNPTVDSSTTLQQAADISGPSPRPSNAPLPSALHNFTSLGLTLPLSTQLFQSFSLNAPTAIQKAAIPQLLKEDADAFIQAETGSGKTLAYLLPIIQHILALNTTTPSTASTSSSKETDSQTISRKSGLFALILAPTRELTHQISTVLNKILQKTPHIVAGQVTGGATKNHEKARLRKGLNILVATPGRLADHLENTEVLDLTRVRWLVLDEGDRLMEMGFEEEVRTVVEALEGRRDGLEGKRARVRREGKASGRMGAEVESGLQGTTDDGNRKPEVKGLPKRRTTVLCSATMKMGVQRLGELSLKDAVLIKVDEADDARTTATALPNGDTATTNDAAAAPTGDANNYQTKTTNETQTSSVLTEEKPAAFLAPAQLKQAYIIAPAKQRLVTLAALLQRTFARKGSVQKAIVFVSCADSVEFHFEVLSRKDATTTQERRRRDTPATPAASESINTQTPTPGGANGQNPSTNHTSSPSPTITNTNKALLPTTSPAPRLTTAPNPTLTLYKLHGSLPQHLRTTTLDSFRRTRTPSILLCTDVASRGLDLPNIDLVIEYDPPFSGEEHLHRVGRTARAGQEGRAICFLMPGAEEKYVEVLKQGGGGGGNSVKGEGAEEVLRKGFASSSLSSSSQSSSLLKSGDGEAMKARNQVATAPSSSSSTSTRWDVLATEWQLDVERWIVTDRRAAELARKAFVSHVRAYATHVAKERYIFDVKELHLGHLAKAFALREKPGSMGRGGTGGNNGRKEKKNGTNRSRVVAGCWPW